MAPRPTTRPARRSSRNSAGASSDPGPQLISQDQADAAASAVGPVTPPAVTDEESKGEDVADLRAMSKAIEMLGTQVAQLSKTVQDVEQRTRGRTMQPGNSRGNSPQGSRSRSPLMRTASEDRAWLERLRRLTGETASPSLENDDAKAGRADDVESLTHNVTNVNTNIKLAQPSLGVNAASVVACGVTVLKRLPPRLARKIQLGRYVDFGKILDPFKKRGSYVKMKTPKGEKAQLGDVLTTEEIEDGPLTHPQWSMAYNLFMDAYCEAHPVERQPMQQYQQYIFDMMAKGGDWQTYDRQYRQDRENNPIPWDWPRADLERQAFLRMPVQVSGAKRGFRSQKADGSNRYCYAYNRAGTICKRVNCPYEHVCSECGERHPYYLKHGKRQFGRTAQPDERTGHRGRDDRTQGPEAHRSGNKSSN